MIQMSMKRESVYGPDGGSSPAVEVKIQVRDDVDEVRAACLLKDLFDHAASVTPATPTPQSEWLQWEELKPSRPGAFDTRAD